jgi:hypothetical protein
MLCKLRPLAAWCVSWYLAAAMTSAYGQQPQAAAHVLDVKGEWHLQGKSELVVSGEGLAAGATITAVSNRPGDAITIVRDEDMSRIHVVCDASTSNPCRNPVAVPGVSSGAATAQSQFSGMVQAAISVLLNRPPAIGSHYALTLTRGAETVQESEGVVALDPATGIVLPPPPPEMPAGRYTISIAQAGEKASAIQQTLLLTSEGQWRPLPLDAPGLYEFVISNADGDQVSDVMLLAVPAPQLQSKLGEFAAMTSRTATWTGPAARSDEHLFLRGFLLSETHP